MELRIPDKFSCKATYSITEQRELTEQPTNLMKGLLRVYRNIFAASYNWYSGIGDYDPYFAAVMIVALCNLVFLFVILTAISAVLHWDIFAKTYKYAKYVAGGLGVLVVFISWRMLPEKATGEMLADFDRKTKGLKRLWGWMIIVFLLACFFAAVFISKRFLH